MYDVASSILQQKLAQVEGVGPGVRRRRRAARGARGRQSRRRSTTHGLGLEDVRAVLSTRQRQPAQGASSPTASAPGRIATTDQLLKAAEYQPLVVSYRNGAAVRLSDVATVTDSVEDVRTSGLANGKPAVLVIVFRQPGANIIETVDRVRALLPQLQADHPADDHARGRHRPHDDDPRVGARRPDHAADLDRPRHPGRLRLPAERPLDAHSERRRAGLAHRHVRRDVSAGLQPRQPVAHGADDRHRLRRGRRDRRHREHHAAPRSRA